MGDRRDRPKRVAGCPWTVSWSSDDDEEASSTRQIHGEERVANTNEASGVDGNNSMSAFNFPVGPSVRNRPQATRMERDLYWTLLNNSRSIQRTVRGFVSPPPARRGRLRDVLVSPAQDLRTAERMRSEANRLLSLTRINRYTRPGSSGLFHGGGRSARPRPYQEEPSVLRRTVPLSAPDPMISGINSQPLTSSESWLQGLNPQASDDGAISLLHPSREIEVDLPLTPVMPRRRVRAAVVDPEWLTMAPTLRYAEGAEPLEATPPERINNVEHRQSEEEANTSGESLDAMQPPEAGAVERAGELGDVITVDDVINVGDVISVNVSVDITDAPDNALAVPSTSAASGDPGQAPKRCINRRRLFRHEEDPPEKPLSSHDFNAVLLRLLECPVCLDSMAPPLWQCRRGHLVCSRCRARLDSCPVCRSTFSSARNRAMEGLADLLRYPCQHGCGREMRLSSRKNHEASCALRRYRCPAAGCTHTPMPHENLAQHFKNDHMSMVRLGYKHWFSLDFDSEQHECRLFLTLDQAFHVRADVNWLGQGLIVSATYIGPVKYAEDYTYEVTLTGDLQAMRISYSRTTHADSDTGNSRRDQGFCLSAEQASQYIQHKGWTEPLRKVLEFSVEIARNAEMEVEEIGEN